LIQSNHNLKKYNTFGIDAIARYYAEPSSVGEAKAVIAEASRLRLPLFVLGGGSNVLFTKDFDGLILKPMIMGIEVLSQHSDKVCVAAGAGVAWDDLVAWCVEQNLGGLENLSNIPGTVGAAPVQNIGAYGAEVGDAIEKVEGFYVDSLEPFSLSCAECLFGYRSSIFKTALRGKALITHVYFSLSSTVQPNTDYGRIEQELQHQPDRSIQSVRRAIISIRSQKLPDPQKLGNAGSFFKNPYVEDGIVQNIKSLYPEIPVYGSDVYGYSKLPAAFLIDKCGWKGVKVGHVGVHSEQPLVLVAFEGAKGTQVLELSKQIQSSVKEKFGVILEPEVNVL